MLRSSRTPVQRSMLVNLHQLALEWDDVRSCHVHFNADFPRHQCNSNYRAGAKQVGGGQYS